MIVPSAHRLRDLSVWLSIALALQAAGGLWIPGLYRDNSWIVSTYRATDILALLVVAPALAVSAQLALRGSPIAELVRLGLVYKVFYNNLYFLVGTAFNRFFLLYVAIAILSAGTLFVAVWRLETPAREAVIGSTTRRRVASGILLALAIVLSVLWVGQSLRFAIQGVLPEIIASTGGSSHLVAALDLTTIVPFLLLGGWRLWRRESWGVVVSSAMLVQGLSITLDLMLASPFQAMAGIPDAWTAFPLWSAMFVAFAIGVPLVLWPSERSV